MQSVILDVRYQIARALHSGGPEAALAAVGAGSIRLCRHVIDGALTWEAAFKALLQVSVNLKLVNCFGRRAVRAAIYAGPTFYDELAEAA